MCIHESASAQQSHRFQATSDIRQGETTAYNSRVMMARPIPYYWITKSVNNDDISVQQEGYDGLTLVQLCQGIIIESRHFGSRFAQPPWQLLAAGDSTHFYLSAGQSADRSRLVKNLSSRVAKSGLMDFAWCPRRSPFRAKSALSPSRSFPWPFTPALAPPSAAQAT